MPDYFNIDDAPPPKGPNGHYAATMHDTHISQRGPWEEGRHGKHQHACWVRRLGGTWENIGSADSEDDAWLLFLSHADLLCCTVLILLHSDGDPNGHSCEGGPGPKRSRLRSCDNTRPRLPDGHESRIAYYEKLVEKKLPLFGSSE